MENVPPHRSRIFSNLLIFFGKVSAWSLCSLAAFVLLFITLTAIAIHTPGGRRLILCPVYDATISSLAATPDALAILKMTSKEWRNVPRPSPDWAYLPVAASDMNPRKNKGHRTEPDESDIVIPVPVQRWTKLPADLRAGTLLHLTSDVLTLKLERKLTIPAKTQARRLREQILAAPLAMLQPAQIGASVYLWQSALESLRGADPSNLLRESFRHDLTQKCAPGAPWRSFLNRLLMAFEKSRSYQSLTAAWRNVTPGSLTLIKPAPVGSVGDQWTVQVLFSTEAAGKREQALSLTYSNLSEPMMHSVMQQIGLIRDTSLADRDLPADFFRNQESSSQSPVAQGDRSAPRL